MTKYTQAPNTVNAIADDIIARYHPNLLTARIDYIFRDKPAKSRGKIVLARVIKPVAYLKAYSQFEDLDFIVEIAEETWVDLTDEQRQALIDHELCHCVYDPDEEKASLKAHGIEEFREIIERHGFWTSSLHMSKRTFAKALQGELPGMEREEGGIALRPEHAQKIEDGIKKNLPEDSRIDDVKVTIGADGWDEADRELMDRNPEIVEVIQEHAEQQDQAVVEEEPA